MSKVSLDLLGEAERIALFKLMPFFKLDGLLSGGTSLMLQIPVRKSYDFDLFFPFEIPENFSRKVSFIFDSNIKVLINTTDELTIIADNLLKISFIFFPFKRKYKAEVIDNFINLASYKDNCSDKAYVIGRRPEYRDYVDLFVILKNGFSLKKIISDAKEKFGGEFSEKLFLSQLIYFDDLKDFTVEYIKDAYNRKEIESFFRQIVLNYEYM